MTGGNQGGFTELIYNHKHGVEPLGEGKIGDKIHCNRFPDVGWDLVWLKRDLGS